jgi:preprotein translocase subunit SecG
MGKDSLDNANRILLILNIVFIIVLIFLTIFNENLKNLVIK